MSEAAKSLPESTDQTLTDASEMNEHICMSSLITGSTNTFEEEVSAADFPMPETGTGACRSRAETVINHSIKFVFKTVVKRAQGSALSKTTLPNIIPGNPAAYCKREKGRWNIHSTLTHLPTAAVQQCKPKRELGNLFFWNQNIAMFHF